MTRSGGSLRTNMQIAVDAVIGSSPRMRATAGTTVAIGSRANRMMQKPITAFQKPMQVHGRVRPKHKSSRASSTPKPPADEGVGRKRQRADDGGDDEEGKKRPSSGQFPAGTAAPLRLP